MKNMVELFLNLHQEPIKKILFLLFLLLCCKIKISEITSIAFTKGPGLLGSLLVGTSFAKSLSLSLNTPLIEVNHMMAHIHAHFIQETKELIKTPNFPFICLTISGGHTQIVHIKSPLEMKVIGSTIDDAVEKLLTKQENFGFRLPAGPIITIISLEMKKVLFTCQKQVILITVLAVLKPNFLISLKKNLKTIHFSSRIT